MPADTARGAMFRPIVPNQHSRVTYAELFFDLVFVFAVTQVSHTLLGHFTPLGVLQVTLLFLALEHRVAHRVDATHAGDEDEIAGARADAPGSGRRDGTFR